MNTSRFISLAAIALLPTLVNGILAPYPLNGQTLMSPVAPSGAVGLLGTDSAVLEMREPRTDLPCSVTSGKPVLGFDLRLHSGYEVSLPLKELAGNGNRLTIIFRVFPVGKEDEPVYFSQHVRVPPIEADAHGDAYFEGAFDLGEGKYHVDWLMRDHAERVCSSYWDIDAVLGSRDKEVPLVIPPGAIDQSEPEIFRGEPSVIRSQDQPLSVKVLMNFAPQNPHAVSLQPFDTNALVSILRAITREPHITRFSLVAFNLQEQRVLYRQEDAEQIDFPALGEALDTLNLGTIDLKRLSQKHGEAQFLTELIRKETEEQKRPDALIFAGPKALIEEGISQEELVGFGTLEYPVFYMNYNRNPQAIPWRDAIGHAVKFLKGTEFAIARPRDLWNAMSEMVTRILKSKSERQAAAAAVR